MAFADGPISGLRESKLPSSLNPSGKLFLTARPPHQPQKQTPATQNEQVHLQDSDEER